MAHYLNLTATRVQLHDKMLYNIQVRLARIDHSIRTIQDIVTFTWISNNLLLDANVVVNRLITGLIVLRNNVEKIYRYLNVIASQEVNPVMIPPPPLRELLAEIQKEMKQNPRLELPYDPQTEIYKFYEVMKMQICLTSQGGLCVMNQALHLVETVEWCVYALFVQDEERIKRDCTMNFKPRKANVAQSIGGYLWAVSSLVGEKMQIRCLTETHVKIIKPPL